MRSIKAFLLPVWLEGARDGTGSPSRGVLDPSEATARLIRSIGCFGSTTLCSFRRSSSVDTRTELLLQHAMAALRTDRTSFVIAHRLSTIRDADLILVMEDGAIVEQGTHDSLLAAEGAYARLYQAQFTAAVPEAVG